jgi:hypothetical protein
VPLPELSSIERAEIEKKAVEIETGKRADDVDEDDAGRTRHFVVMSAQWITSYDTLSGVKRPSEHHADDGHGNMKNNRHHRTDFMYDNDYNPSK